MRVEAKLEELGLALPEPAKLPPGVQASFAWVRIYGDRVYVSGHGPLAPDGTPAGPFGKVGAEVSPEQGYEAARSTALSVLSSLKRELGDLQHLAMILRQQAPWEDECLFDRPAQKDSGVRKKRSL